MVYINAKNTGEHMFYACIENQGDERVVFIGMYRTLGVVLTLMGYFICLRNAKSNLKPLHSPIPYYKYRVSEFELVIT